MEANKEMEGYQETVGDKDYTKPPRRLDGLNKVEYWYANFNINLIPSLEGHGLVENGKSSEIWVKRDREGVIKGVMEVFAPNYVLYAIYKKYDPKFLTKMGINKPKFLEINDMYSSDDDLVVLFNSLYKFFVDDRHK